MALPTPDFSRIELAQQLFAKSAGPSTVIRRKEQVAQAQQAIDQLRPNYREVLLLRYVEQLSMSEIGAVLGISVAAVKMRHVRALERLRELLENPSEVS
jgi:RNA polymerase sigma-70 factor (ECF subfamily)